MKKILWKVNFVTIVMMAADAPHYVHGEKPKYINIENEEQLFSALEKKMNKGKINQKT
jgi:hypothetical protein